MLDIDGIYRVVNCVVKCQTDPSGRLQSGPAGGGMVAEIIDTSKLPST